VGSEQAKTLFHFIGDMGSTSDLGLLCLRTETELSLHRTEEAMALYQLGLVTRDIASAADNIKAVSSRKEPETRKTCARP
jgi:hypothetical protein